MRRVLAELCSGSECRGISGNPVGDLAGRVRSLGRRNLRGLLTSARGVRQRVFIERRDLFDIVLTGDLNPTLRAELPGALTSARRGDSAPLIRLAARSAGIISFQGASTEFSDAVFAATLCEEGLFPWDRAAGLPARSQQINAAARAAGAGGVQPVRPHDGADERGGLAVRRLAGRLAAARARRAAAERPDARHQRRDGRAHAARGRQPRQVAHPGGAGARASRTPGHSTLASDLSDEQCAMRAVAQFFAGQPVTPCAASANPFSPTPVAPTNINRLKATGRGGKVGRTVTAAVLTAQDMRRQIIGDILEAGRIPSRAGGLRGGRVVVRNSVLQLFDVVYVPGVKVSGSVPLAHVDPAPAGERAEGRPRDAHRSAGERITGRIGGRRINVAARAAAASSIAEPDWRTLLRRHRLRNAG